MGIMVSVAAGWIAWKNPFLFTVMKIQIESLSPDKTPDWKTYNYPDLGISLESPFSIHWDLKELKTKDGLPFQSLFGLSNINQSGFLASVSSYRFKHGDHTFNSDKELEVKTWVLQNSGYNAPKWESKAVTCSGMPATLVTGSYSERNEPYKFSYLLVVNDNQYWAVNVSQDLSIKNDGEMIDRVIQSVKIGTQIP